MNILMMKSTSIKSVKVNMIIVLLDYDFSFDACRIASLSLTIAVIFHILITLRAVNSGW